MMNQRNQGLVLVIDDHPLSCTLLERILELDGYETLAAGSIAQAQQILAITLPALIVLDVRLPDGDGLEFARRLKSDAATAACAIVACSASPEEQRRALGAGCDAYVGKPIEIRNFTEVVAALTAPKASPKAARL